jgi:MotA/TolQ/ExbB proton channel family protein
MNASPRRNSLAGALAFAVGAPLGVGVLWAVLEGPWRDTEWKRYFEHLVEQTEVILFCCALTALLGKLLACLRQRSLQQREPLPKWNGKAVPAANAKALLDQVVHQPRSLRESWLGRRVVAILDFVRSRGAANELDDQLRTLADNDALAQESSFALLRLVIWAIPILGFLGTVIGITGAIAGVTPETLEQSLSGVTQGLSTAFDCTALALALTMILMFFTYVAERFEQNLLGRVDAYVDAELAHRFERTGPESSPIIEALRHNSDSLVHTAEQLVAKQAVLWTQSIETMERRFQEAAPRQLDQMQRALEQAFEASVARHAQQLRQTEEKFFARSQALLEGLTLTSEKLRLQAAGLAQLQDNESQLLRLQEALNSNLAAVANTGSFDQAVQSLTAAIHLLTSRASAALPPRVATKPAA